MPTYPRKQTAVVFIVCLVAVAAVAVYVYGQTPLKQSVGSQPLAVSAQAQEDQTNTVAISTSTDWKKQFFGNASAGGSFKTATANASSGPAESLTATEQFSRDVFTQYVNLKQAGLVNDAAVVSTTVSDLLAKDYSGSDKPRVYTMDDIIISPNDNTSALKAYGNNIGSILLAYSPQQDSATIALAGMQGKDPSYAEELQANAGAYQTILTKLLAIPAPQNVSSYHLGLVNCASYMAYIATALSVSGTDPMRSINSLGLYQTAFSAGLGNMVSIRNAFLTAGITYNNSEGGSVFFNNAQKI